MKSRSEYAIVNFFTGGFGEILLVFTNLITRKVLYDVLGGEYLGISSLFTSILSVLSLTELGIGTSIVFHMYKPVAEKDTKHIMELLMFFRKAYHIIGIVISGISLIILPLLPVIIEDAPNGVNIYVLFVIYLLQTLSSYFFYGYTRALLQANQKQYVINGVQMLITFITMIGQVLVLILFKNIYLYIGIRTITTILQNILVAIICHKIYPYTTVNISTKLSSEESKNIFKDCYALLIYRVNGVILYSVDSIIITKFLGLIVNGIYSNYAWISTTIKNVSKIMFKSVCDGIGNLHAVGESVDVEYKVFKRLNLLTVVINGIALNGIFNVAILFITTYLGSDMKISWLAVFLISIEVYLSGIIALINSYRNAYGLFQQAKYRPIASTIVNLVVSIILVKPLGLVGVLIGTIASNLFTTFIYDSHIVFKYAFEKKVSKFYRANIKYFIITMVACSISSFIINKIDVLLLNPWIEIIIRCIISVAVPSLIYYLIWGRTEEFKILLNYINRVLRRKKND